MQNTSRNGRNWLVAPHHTPPAGSPADVRPDVLRALADELADLQADSRALVRVGLLRELVRFALQDLEPGTPGAAITDFDTRTTYRATIGRGDGAVWLQSLSIEHTDGRPVDRADLRRVPVQQIAEATAQSLEENSEPGVLVVRDGEVELEADHPHAPDKPSSVELAEMMREGHNRRTLAARYGRSLSTVDDWIGRARREVPELMPPPGKGGRPRKKQPNTSSTDQDMKGTGR